MPNIILTVIIAILVFGVIIIIHELGHFLVAKANGVKINEFSFGMGPALFGFTKGETRYSVRAFPLGGYVSMEGEDEDSEDERSFGKKKWWQKLLIVVAGAVMNLILGLIILMCLTFPNDAIGTTTLAQFNEGSQSQSAGLQIDDKIVKINNSAVHIDMDIVYEPVSYTHLDVYKRQVLKEAEKVELLKKVKQGDEQAREKLINGNLRLVLSVVQKFVNRGENLDDLFQVGCIGLILSLIHI